MRTTLSLDDDVVVMLDRVRQARGATMKDVVNDALRAGLVQLDRPAPPAQREYTVPTSLGQPLLAQVDNTAEVLALTEGDGFR